MEYKFIQDLLKELQPPEKGIVSRVLQKDQNVNVTVFGFAAGAELSSHAAPTPAVLYFLEGSADVQLGNDVVHAEPGSFVSMPPNFPHGIGAKTPVRMLLVQVKTAAG